MNHAAVHTDHAEADQTDIFGFWLYIMTDCLLFAALFAVFLVLNFRGAPGPVFKEHISLPYVLGETFFLLASNFTYGLVMINLYKNKLSPLLVWLAMSFLLGLGFVYMEVAEFIHLAGEGYRWDVSGAASAFFTLVGTHGFHVSMGLLWILVMLVQVSVFKIKPVIQKRLIYLGLFWSFLDIVWIFLFTIVYLMGAR